MRIGILTQPLGENYGGILQNWALQQVLKKLGHESKTIVYDNYPQWKRRILRIVYDGYAFVNILLGKSYDSNSFGGYDRNFKKLRQFVKKFVSQTIPYKTFDFNIISNKYKFEAYIVGSDQVWRPLFNQQQLYSMFCSFIPENAGVGRLAYAASFGVDKCEFSEEQLSKVRHYLKSFDAISVRELSGIRLCEESMGQKAKLVLDPTLLLQWEDYSTLITKKDCKDLPQKYVGVYIIDKTQEKKDYVDNICKKLGLMPYYIGTQSVETGMSPSVSWC